MNDHNTRFTEYAGLKLAYTVQGNPDSETIVMQHGWTSSKEAFSAYADAFVSEGYHCISIDSLGHGESDRLQKQLFTLVKNALTMSLRS